MLTTAEPDGSLRSRPMATQNKPFDGTLWFFTEIQSGKVHEIDADRHVNLSYANPDDQSYVSVSGVASVVRNRAKAEEFWSPALKAWFPKGLDDPSLALLRVDVSEAEYWQAPHSAVVKLVGFVKALATGQKYTPGENKRFDVDAPAKTT
jgi:general stress protein 26